MKTIRLVLEAALLKAADQAARGLRLNRSAFIRQAVAAHLRTLHARELEESDRQVDEFVEHLLRRVAEADVRFERGVPVFRPRPGAPVLKVEDVDRLSDGRDT